MVDNNLGPFRINPRGNFDPNAQYRFLDSVFYNHSSYLCINYDTIDGVSCIGVLPTGEERSDKYWTIMAEGVKGDIAPQYDSFITLDSPDWDYRLSDKVYLADSFDEKATLNIRNVYDGCCGIIITNKNLTLPINSDVSIDFNYVDLQEDEYYLYSFIYCYLGESDYKFIWNRTAYRNVS